MNPDSQNFDSLRRLLALKRHEQPPPGYFNRFSRDVMARIKAGEGGGEESFELPFFQRLFALFDVKPVFAGAFGMGMCALLISGVIASETDKPTGLSAASVAQGSAPAENSSAIVVPPAPASYVVEQSSTNGLSLFDQLARPQAEQAGYWIPNRN